MSDEKDSFSEIVQKYWVPAIITAVLGGIVVAIIVPQAQSNYADVSVLKQRKIQLWESIGVNFTHYINARSRLNTAAREEIKLKANEGEVSADFLKKKDEDRSQRNESLTNLRGDLLKAEFYFGEDIKKLIGSFVTWHNKHSVAAVDQLPSDSEYDEWRQRILSAIGTKLKSELGS